MVGRCSVDIINTMDLKQGDRVFLNEEANFWLTKTKTHINSEEARHERLVKIGKLGEGAKKNIRPVASQRNRELGEIVVIRTIHVPWKGGGRRPNNLVEGFSLLLKRLVYFRSDDAEPWTEEI